MDRKYLVELTTEIVSSHASMNELTKEELVAEIQSVFGILSGLAGEGEMPAVEAAAAAPVKPAMPVDAAFAKDKVFCLVCGAGFKTLKKHIKTAHGLEPRSYREMFGIPAKTPLVASNYSEKKRETAQKLGLAEKLAEGRAKRAARLKG